MRALVLPAYGPASTLTLRTHPDPTPAAGQIAIRMAGASINPIDWKQMSGAAARWIPLELPAVLGRDVSGTVIAVGAGVADFAVGARVMGRVRGGAFAEVAVGAAGGFVGVPAGLELADAAALPLALLTGAQLVEEAIDARAGETVLVTGATGSVGRAAVFAAKGRGAKVWAGVRGKYVAAARGLGVEGVVALDEAGAGAAAALPELDGIADTVGGETGGGLVAKLPPPPPPPPPPARPRGGGAGGGGGGGEGEADRGEVDLHARRRPAARGAGPGGRRRCAGHPDRPPLPARRGRGSDGVRPEGGRGEGAAAGVKGWSVSVRRARATDVEDSIAD